MKGKYDIFISYRREGGFDTAKHLFDLLSKDGYSVSFDIDTLGNGNFEVSLLKRIEECTDFILIVDKHAFDRCVDPNFDRDKDWLRCELAHALSLRKNVIPIKLSGVNSFPENLPEDIASVVKMNGPDYTKSYFDSFYRRLLDNFIKSSPYSCNIKPFEDDGFVVEMDWYTPKSKIGRILEKTLKKYFKEK